MFVIGLLKSSIKPVLVFNKHFFIYTFTNLDKILCSYLAHNLCLLLITDYHIFPPNYCESNVPETIYQLKKFNIL